MKNDNADCFICSFAGFLVILRGYRYCALDHAGRVVDSAASLDDLFKFLRRMA